MDEAKEQAAALSLQAYNYVLPLSNKAYEAMRPPLMKAYDHVLLGYDMGMKYGREYTKGVKIGDFDIGEVLFPEARENEEDALKKAKENMKKAGLAAATI